MTLNCMSMLGPTPPPAFHLVEEISHRVINEYAEAISSLSLAARRAPNVEVRDVLARVAGKLQAQALAHRALSAPIAEGPIDLGDYLAEVCACMTNSLLADRRIMFRLETDDIELGAERCWRVGLIVAELIRNAVRHGLTGYEGAIGVSVTAAAGRVTCLVRDDGAPAQTPTMGRGRKVVLALAAELGGRVQWRFTDEGCLVRLEFPETVPDGPGWPR